MTIYELHRQFDFQLDKASSGAYPDIPHKQRDQFLNLGYERFIKERYNGLNTSRTSYEETQKRRDDLSILTSSSLLQIIGQGYGNNSGIISNYYSLPEDYWITVSELVEIKPDRCSSFLTKQVFMARHNQLPVLLEDPFNKPKRDEVFSIQENFNGQQVKQLFFDASSIIRSYRLNYIGQYRKLVSFSSEESTLLQNNPNFLLYTTPTYHTLRVTTPVNITVNNVNYTLPSWITTEYWASLQSHQEIVDLAVKLALEVIESPRYRTFTEQTLTSE